MAILINKFTPETPLIVRDAETVIRLMKEIEGIVNMNDCEYIYEKNKEKWDFMFGIEYDKEIDKVIIYMDAIFKLNDMNREYYIWSQRNVSIKLATELIEKLNENNIINL